MIHSHRAHSAVSFLLLLFLLSACSTPREESGTVGGLELFVSQAVMQFTALTGYEAPRSLMYDVASEQLKA